MNVIINPKKYFHHYITTKNPPQFLTLLVDFLVDKVLGLNYLSTSMVPLAE
ncbi:hypothetical protein AO382_1732 [Moraxella catarrhalis]|uniref:Uncharacterized protein n=1 Tax=Moraxella catarrhalis TaxID=480 RepID=A0A7Z0UXC2_MORCA|nr:hypothetical protein AO382_1732 [Moraxella catarrhalis]